MEFKTKPYEHQLQAFERSKDEPFFGLFAEMGLGKTKITIDNFNYLYDKGEVQAMVVIAPKSVYLNWYKEVEIHFNKEEYIIAHYSAQLRKAERQALAYATNHLRPVPTIVLMNIESISTTKGFKAIDEVMRLKKTMMVIDESSTIKGYKSKRTTHCIALRGLARYRRILTGTPNPHSPLDFYSQLEFLNKGLSGSVNYHAFMYTYCEVQMVELGPNRPSYRKITGYQNLERLQNIIEPVCVRMLKKDCLDLPEKIYKSRYVDMTKEQRVNYENLRDLAIIEHKKGELTVQSALSTLAKCHQISSGFVKLDNGEVAHFDNAKIKELDMILDEIDIKSKIIIWTAFREDLFAVEKLIKEKYDSSIHPPLTYYADTSQDERQEAIRLFQNVPNAKTFISTVQCGSRGITLTEAEYVIYFSNMNNLEHRLQSEDRAHRIGQKKNVTYIDIIANCEVDKRVKSNLIKKAKWAEKTLENVKRVITLEEAIRENPENLLKII